MKGWPLIVVQAHPAFCMSKLMSNLIGDSEMMIFVDVHKSEERNVEGHVSIWKT